MPNHEPINPLSQEKIGRYQHYSGGIYEVICIARHSETLEELVTYRQLDKDTGYWVRPYSMFFQEIEHNGLTQPRFKKIK